MTIANRVVVYRADHYERLIAHSASLAGWFDPRQGYGEVTFTTQAQAQAARREL